MMPAANTTMKVVEGCRFMEERPIPRGWPMLWEPRGYEGFASCFRSRRARVFVDT